MTNINSLFCVATVCFIISDLFSRGRIGNRTLAWVFSCKFGHLFRTPFPKNTSGGAAAIQYWSSFQKISNCLIFLDGTCISMDGIISPWMEL